MMKNNLVKMKNTLWKNLFITAKWNEDVNQCRLDKRKRR